MKKIILAIIAVLIISLIIYFTGGTYTVKIKTVDSFSPDRILEVYKDNKKIDYEEIQYDDGTTLCYSKNSTVAYTDLIEEKELQVVLKKDKKVKAKIIED